MPRSSTSPELQALLTASKAARAEQRAAEAPIRRARRKLSERLRRAVRSVGRYNLIIAGLLDDKGRGFFVNTFKLDEAEHGLVDATATFKSCLADLMAFDLANNIEADYPTLPVLDREATVAAGRARYEKAMAEARARYFCPRPAPTPTPQ